MRNAECGMDGGASGRKAASALGASISIPHSALRTPHYGSRRSPPPRVEIVLEQQRGGEGVEISFAAPCGSAHFPDRLQRARRGEALVPQRDGAARAPRDVRRQGAGGGRRLAF